MDEHFWKDWEEATNKFVVVEHRVWGVPTMMNRYLHAEADTGSKYEVLGMDAQADWRSVDETYFITVSLPWCATWTSAFGSVIYPNYAMEHWRSPRRTMNEMHGGDAAALTIALNIICGHNLEHAVSFAKSFIVPEASDAQ
jgi:hypothetical protein